MPYRPTQGFSLVELSVSLIIIGLLVAGVTAGSELITSMRLQKTIKELYTLKGSIDDFVETRNYYPGDFPEASAEWTAVNGNGDWSISNSESTHLMHHLYNAGNIEHLYSAGGALQADKNLMNTPLKPSVFWIHSHTTPVYNRKGEAIDIAAITTGSAATNGGLSPEYAYLLDSKIDDGNPGTGEFTVSNGTDASDAGTPCILSSGSENTPDFSKDTLLCVGHYWISE